MLPEDFRILIGYDQRLILDGIKLIIDSKPNSGNQVQLAVKNGSDLARIVTEKKFQADLILIQIEKIDDDSFGYVKSIVELVRPGPVFLVISNIGLGFVHDLIDIGVSGIMLSVCGKNELHGGIDRVKEGRKYFCSGVTQLLSAEFHRDDSLLKVGITQREKEILRYLLNGFTNKEISSILNISQSTVKTHRSNIMEKFNARTQIDLLKKALPIFKKIPKEINLDF